MSTECRDLPLRRMEDHFDALGALWCAHRSMAEEPSPDPDALAALALHARSHLAGLREPRAEVGRRAAQLLHSPYPDRVFAGAFVLLCFEPSALLDRSGLARIERVNSRPIGEALRYAAPGGPWAVAMIGGDE